MATAKQVQTDRPDIELTLSAHEADVLCAFLGKYVGGMGEAREILSGERNSIHSALYTCGALSANRVNLSGIDIWGK